MFKKAKPIETVEQPVAAVQPVQPIAAVEPTPVAAVTEKVEEVVEAPIEKEEETNKEFTLDDVAQVVTDNQKRIIQIESRLFRQGRI